MSILDGFFGGVLDNFWAGPLRAAVRQMLIPDAWGAPLGGHVLARHLDDRVTIDWAAVAEMAAAAAQPR